MFAFKVCPIYTSETGRPCSKLSFGDGNIVCRCNATYCDTVEPVEPLTPGTFARYTSSREGRRLDRSLGRFSQAPDGGKLQEGIGGTLKTLTNWKRYNIRLYLISYKYWLDYWLTWLIHLFGTAHRFWF